MPFAKLGANRSGVFWVAIGLPCLGCAVLGGMLLDARREALPKAKIEASGSPGARDDELNALRADVQRLRSAVGVIAARPAAVAAPEPVEESPQAPPEPPPEIGLTKDDVVMMYEENPPNVQQTRALAASLDERLRKPAFADSQIRVDEVECRGDACRASVSFAEDASPEAILLELAAAVPDSHSYQDFTPAQNQRRTVISHYKVESPNAAR